MHHCVWLGKEDDSSGKKLFILFWISFRFFFYLMRSDLTTGTGIGQGETSVSSESLEIPSKSILAA